MANNVIDAAIRLRDLFTPTVHSVNASLGTMKTQMAAAKQSVSGLSDKLTEHERIQKRTAKSIEQTGSKISGLSDKIALLSAPILAAATAGFKLHSDFANGIAKISTLVDTTVVSMQKVSDEIRAVSDETGAGVADLSESVYQAISAGVDAAHAVGFVKDMTIAAKAGFTDTTTAVNGVTTVLNAYGKSAEEATAVTDQMLLAQNFGKTSFGEMAQSMGNVIPHCGTAQCQYPGTVRFHRRPDQERYPDQRGHYRTQGGLQQHPEAVCRSGETGSVPWP